jgi:hypothetical protein
MDGWATARETYLTEECAAAEERERDESELGDRFADDCLDTEERLTWQGEFTAVLGRMYQEAANRADQAEGLARALTKYTDGVVALVDHNLPALGQSIRERDEARVAMDGLKVRSRGMWECLTKAATGAASLGQFAFAKLLSDAAGEPIP